MASATEAAPLLQVPLGHPRKEPSRMDLSSVSSEQRGFREGLRQKVAQSVRKSTTRVYLSEWAIFCGCFSLGNLNPLSASVQRIADFLKHLRREKGLFVLAVRLSIET